MRPFRIKRGDSRRPRQSEDPSGKRVSAGHLRRGAAVVLDVHLRLVVTVVRVRVARVHLPVASRLELVSVIDDDAGRADVPGDTGESVIELVDQLHLAHAEVVDLVETGLDVFQVARRGVPRESAIERDRDLDPEHDGQLPLVDHLARLEGIVDDPEPSFARAPVLRVDVVARS